MNPIARPDRQAAEDLVSLPATLRSAGELAAALRLDRDGPSDDAGFPVRVPAEFVRRMRPGDPADPLLLQVLPAAEETRTVPGFTDDPVGDLASTIAPGVLQKYHSRALLITTGACAIHCRYCFRRAFPYAGQSLAGERLNTAVAAIAADPDLEEIILSGGDPLSLSKRRLALLLEALTGIGHVKRLRIHTRTPVVAPARIDASLLQILADCPLPVIIVLHCNHAAEIDADVARAVKTLKNTGATLLNQSVLLKGINATPASLTQLSRKLFEIGVLPYYLHQLDPVTGTAHFSVDDEQAAAIMKEVADSLPGYLVPKLVREIPGERAKTPV